MKILVYGFGNPARQDDALGIEFVHRMQQMLEREFDTLSNIEFDIGYQLNIEDALKISRYDEVYFVDASYDEKENFNIVKLYPKPLQHYSMHSVEPAFILDICRELYGVLPETYMVKVRGYEWQMKEGLSPAAEQNLSLALDAFQYYIESDIQISEKQPMIT
ncbi:MAG TPA: hypothetical protein DDY13_14840 [Cytophagales bacterium]|jgi:hydrogenase maturation protease|nr:hypothetical protein [Cytophagales bacterium]